MTTVQEFTGHLNNLANRTVPTLLYLSERYAESEPRAREALAQVEAEMAQIIAAYTTALARAEAAEAKLEQATVAVRERCALVCEKRAAMWEEVATKPASYPVALHDAKAAEAWSCGADIRAME